MITVRVSAGELESLKQAAGRAGVSVSELMLTSVLGSNPRRAEGRTETRTGGAVAGGPSRSPSNICKHGARPDLCRFQKCRDG